VSVHESSNDADSHGGSVAREQEIEHHLQEQHERHLAALHVIEQCLFARVRIWRREQSILKEQLRKGMTKNSALKRRVKKLSAQLRSGRRAELPRPSVVEVALCAPPTEALKTTSAGSSCGVKKDAKCKDSSSEQNLTNCRTSQPQHGRSVWRSLLSCFRSSGDE